MNGQAARQQADRVEDRRFEHFARGRSGDALPHIEQIGNHENREDRRLGNDETGHRDLAAIGRLQAADASGNGFAIALIAFFLYSQRLFIRNGCLDLRDASGPTTAGGSRPTGMEAKLYAGGGELMDHSSVHASQGSLPALAPLK